jgi:hypothetical protein
MSRNRVIKSMRSSKIRKRSETILVPGVSYPYSVLSLPDANMGSMNETAEAKQDAQRARRMKQIGFGTLVVILIIVALALGLYFGAFKNRVTGGSS